MRRIDTIVIHCSDSPNGRDFRASDILSWHTDPKPRGRGWRHAGYHFVICVDGAVESLVPLDDDQYIEASEVANGARGYNAHSIHICMIGKDRFTPKQWDALSAKVSSLLDRLEGVSVVGHNQLDSHKTCPNFPVDEWLEDQVAIVKQHEWKGD